MAARKPWFHMPSNLMDDDRYLDLSYRASTVLCRLYATCDRWGRGPAGKRTLTRDIDIPQDDAQASVVELDGAGLIRTFTSTDGIRCYEILHYDVHCPDTRKRKDSTYQPGRAMAVQGLPGQDRAGQGGAEPPAAGQASQTRVRGELELELELESPLRGLDASTPARAPIHGASEHRSGPGDDFRPILPPPAPKQPPPAPPTHPAPPAPPRQQPDSLERVSPGLPIDDTLPPLGDTAQGLVDELVRRITATPMGTGLHSPGFFGRGGDSGMVAFESKLRLLQERNPQAVVAASRGFWPSVDREGGPDHWPRDPTRRLEQWLADKGHRVPFAAQVMREVAGG